jgi:hypothetical protein
VAVCLTPVGIAVCVGIGLVLMLWGRNRLIRSVGVLLSSMLGPVIAWGASRLLRLSLGQRLLGLTPSEGETFLIGQDITLDQLIWIPLQDAGFYLVILLFVLFMVFRRGEVVHPISRGYTLDDLLFDWSLDQYLDNHRPEARLGGLAYQVVVWLSVLLALPVMGLIAYITLQVLLAAGITVPIKEWIDRSVISASILFELLFLFINSIVALQDEKPIDGGAVK